MVTQIRSNLETDLVPARTLRRILRDVNRATGRYVVDVILKKKFSRQAYIEYPDVVRRRTKRYSAWKRKKVGHDIPNVLTGRMLANYPHDSRVTATANGGRVYFRNYFPMRESTRQEIEALNDRDRARMAERQEDEFHRLVNLPENRRKRRKKGSAA